MTWSGFWVSICVYLGIVLFLSFKVFFPSLWMMCIDNSLNLHIYIIVRKHYHTYFELIHAIYIWFWNNDE